MIRARVCLLLAIYCQQRSRTAGNQSTRHGTGWEARRPVWTPDFRHRGSGTSD